MLLIIVILCGMVGLKMAGNNGKPNGKPVAMISWQRNGKDGKPISYQYSEAVVAEWSKCPVEVFAGMPVEAKLAVAQRYHAAHSETSGGARTLAEKVLKYFVGEDGNMEKGWRETIKAISETKPEDLETIRQSILKTRKADQKANQK